MRKKFEWIYLVLAFASITGGAAQGVNADLLQQVAAAKSQFTTVGAPELSQTKAELVAALGELQSYLDSRGNYAAQEWKTYLNWDRLNAEVARADLPDLKALDEIVGNFYRSYDDMDLAPFLRVRADLKKWIAEVKLHFKVITAQDYAARLASLEKILASTPVERLSQAPRQQVAATYAWLGELGQASDLTSALRAAFGRENFHLAVGGLSDVTLMNVNQIEPVNEEMFGSQVVGQTQSYGEAHLVFYPNFSTPDIRVELRGTADTYSTAYRRLAEVSTHAQTALYGSKNIGFNSSDLLVSPAWANCTTWSEITGVSAGPIIRRIAWRRAEALQPQANAYASSRANQRIASQLDAEVNTRLAKMNGLYHQYFTQPLQKLGFQPFLAGASTTSDQLLAGFRLTRDWDLGAPSGAPAFAAASEFELDLHESMIENTMGILLGGVKMAGADALDTAGRLFSLPAGARDDDTYVVFAAENPLLLQLTDENQIGVIVNLRKFVRSTTGSENGATGVAEDVQVAARYAIAQDAQGWSLVRQGGLQVTAKSRFEGEFRTFVSAKLERLFQPVLHVRGDFLQKNPLGVTLLLNQVAAKDGWLHFGVNRVH